MDDKPMEFFFWLEDEGLAQSLTEKDFSDRIEATQEAERKWRDVELN